MQQANPNYVVVLVTDKDAYLYVNGELCSVFDHKSDSEDEFDTLAQDMAEMYNTETQCINVSDIKLQSIFGSSKINMFNLDWEMAIKVLDIKPIVAEHLDINESISRDLEAGVLTDIWFDALEFGDTLSYMRIKKTQSAMKDAMLLIKNVNNFRAEAMAVVTELLAATNQLSVTIEDKASKARYWLAMQDMSNDENIKP